MYQTSLKKWILEENPHLALKVKTCILIKDTFRPCITSQRRLSTSKLFSIRSTAQNLVKIDDKCYHTYLKKWLEKNTHLALKVKTCIPLKDIHTFRPSITSPRRISVFLRCLSHLSTYLKSRQRSLSLSLSPPLLSFLRVRLVFVRLAYRSCNKNKSNTVKCVKH